MPENWHKRHAIQLAAQLPERPEDALIVLELIKEIVERFLAPRPCQVVQSCGSLLKIVSEPKREAIELPEIKPIQS